MNLKEFGALYEVTAGYSVQLQKKNGVKNMNSVANYKKYIDLGFSCNGEDVERQKLVMMEISTEYYLLPT